MANAYPIMKKRIDSNHSTPGSARRTSKPPSEPPPRPVGPVEEWYRLPAPRGGRLFGLSRTTLTELAIAGSIKSVLLRKPGAKRGIRLIHGPSLQQYLLGEMEAQMKTLDEQPHSPPARKCGRIP